MPTDRIVIIGGVACGPKVAARARRCDPDIEIILVERGPYLSYAGCGLPYYIGGSVERLEELWTTQYAVERNKAFFKDVKDVDVHLRTEATRIDRENRTIHLRNLETGEETDLEYGQLVLATGASPVRPPIEGLDSGRVFCLHNPGEAEEIRNLIEADLVDRAVIIGGGSIGLEVVESFFAHAVDSTVVEMEGQLLPNLLDPDIADYVASELKSKGTECLTCEKVLMLEANGEGNVAKVVTDKREIEADMVLVAAGVRPNVELARNCGLAIGTVGAIEVNDRLQTSDPLIFAGGDCVECRQLVTGKKVFAPLGSTANKHGRIIGTNLTGGNESFPGVVCTAIVKSMNITIARTGLTSREAREAGIEAIATLTPSLDKAHYSPGGKPFLMKLLVEKGTERLLGAQAAGPGDVAKRIDVLAAVLTYGGNLKDLSDLDLAYAPPFSSAVDPVAHAANYTRNRLAGLGHPITAPELLDRLNSDDDFVLLDVRQPKEMEHGKIEDSRLRHVSLLDVRREMADVSREVEVICLCQSGPRSYEACVTLNGMGFKKTCFLEGGIRVWAFLANGGE